MTNLKLAISVYMLAVCSKGTNKSDFNFIFLQHAAVCNPTTDSLSVEETRALN
ncbi:MAG TPA: hypothetical protein VIJ95_19000 [Hanamia sp.]